MSLHVEQFDGEAAEWNAFVRRQPGWTHFHLSEWRDVITTRFGHECPFLCARSDEGTIEGVLPLVRVRSRIFGHYLVSMPFVNYGGPLGSGAAVTELVDRASAMARGDRADLLELRCGHPLDLSLPVSHRKVTVVRDLPPDDPDALWSALKAKVRSQVRRPQKEGVEVRFGADQVAPFYTVFCRHMRDLGTPVLPRGWFDTLASTFGDSVWFACAYLDGQPIAGGGGFLWDGEFEITWASSLRSHNRIAPNMLLYWEMMAECVRRRVGRFNFGRCTPGSGTHRFKMQWGGEELPLWWYQYASGARAKTPSPDDAAYAWGPRLWRRLPVPMANAIGPRIVRFLP